MTELAADQVSYPPRTFFELALPNREHSVIARLELCDYPFIPDAVGGEFLFPERTVALRYGRPHAAAMRMPVTAVNEDGPALRSVREIRIPGQIAVTYAIPEPECTREAPDEELCRGAVLSDAAESLRGCFIDLESEFTASSGRTLSRRSVAPFERGGPAAVPGIEVAS